MVPAKNKSATFSILAEQDWVAGLRGLGPASRTMLEAVGINSIETLRQLGAVEAWCRVREGGHRPSLNLLWALEGALSGTRWQDIGRRHRTSLLLAVEDRDRIRKNAGD